MLSVLGVGPSLPLAGDDEAGPGATPWSSVGARAVYKSRSCYPPFLPLVLCHSGCKAAHLVVIFTAMAQMTQTDADQIVRKCFCARCRNPK